MASKKKLLGTLALFALSFSPVAVTWDELESDSDLKPHNFAIRFADFDYRFRSQVQPPEVFLATKSGDCDDYAVLAAQVLGNKGYTTRLVAVRMKNRVTHVVCAVDETQTYLDYNNRRRLISAMPTDGTLADVAEQVAASFRDDWTSVSEFTYDGRSKRLVRTEVRSVNRNARQQHAAAK